MTSYVMYYQILHVYGIFDIDMLDRGCHLLSCQVIGGLSNIRARITSNMTKRPYDYDHPKVSVHSSYDVRCKQTFASLFRLKS